MNRYRSFQACTQRLSFVNASIRQYRSTVLLVSDIVLSITTSIIQRKYLRTYVFIRKSKSTARKITYQSNSMCITLCIYPRSCMDVLTTTKQFHPVVKAVKIPFKKKKTYNCTVQVILVINPHYQYVRTYVST